MAGSFALVGTDAANVGHNDKKNFRKLHLLLLKNGGDISAQYYSISYPDATGLNLLAGANLLTPPATFPTAPSQTAPAVGRYLWFQFNPAGAIAIEEVTFNSGPANNVKYESGDAADLISFNNWGGLLGGADFEDDDEATTSAHQWFVEVGLIQCDPMDRWHQP